MTGENTSSVSASSSVILCGIYYNFTNQAKDKMTSCTMLSLDPEMKLQELQLGINM